MNVNDSESGAFLSLGRRLSLSLRVVVDRVDELEVSWMEVASRIEAWHQRRGGRAHGVTIWYTVPHEVATAAKCHLGEHLLCQARPELRGLKVHAFVVDSHHGFYCEIGLPSLD